MPFPSPASVTANRNSRAPDRSTDTFLVTAVGGLLDIVVPEETGLLIPPASPDDIARAIRALRADPERRQRLGLAGQQRARERFGAQRYVRDVDAFYQGLLARPRGLPWSLWPARPPA